MRSMGRKKMTNLEQLKLTFESELYLMSSEDIRDFIEQMPLDNQAAIEDFCSWLDIPSWYQEALELHNPNIRNWLIEVAEAAESEEALIAEDERILEQSIRAAQGWY